ncbi:MAG: PucR family transcriptional regulator [Candidatus Methylomirabilales bacterium]
MLTVQAALGLPALKSAKLVAGERGLSNAIRWVHIVDLPHPKFDWVEGGELLLTSGYGLADGEQNPIPMLAAKGLAGIVLALGERFEKAPATLLSAADKHNLPLIETPPGLAFIDVTEAILGEILNEQYKLRRKGDEIQRSLMDQVLEGNSLQQVAEALARILDRSITVENEVFDVLAAAQAGPVDEARTRSVREGRTTPELAKELIDRGIYSQLLEERHPVRVSPMPELGMTMERIVAPVLVAQRIVGYVWIIAGDRALTELDELAIDHAATVTAVILLKEQEVRQAELERRGDLLEQLIDLSGPPEPGLVERVHRMGFRSDQPFQVLLLEGNAAASERSQAMTRNLERWLEEVNGPAMVSSRGELVVIVLQSQIPGMGVPLAERLVGELSHPSLTLVIGVGAPVDDLIELHSSFHQAAEALEFARAQGLTEGAVSFAELGMLHWLLQLPEEVLQGNLFFQAVLALATHDKSHGSQLLETLEAYLNSGGTATAAARQLNLHRNSLSYRLRRIEELIDVDLSRARDRFELYAAIQAFRMHS